MPSVPDLIEDAMVTKLNAITGLTAIDHEPQTLGRTFPLATMLFVGAPQVEYETGGTMEVTWTWRINLYIDLTGDWKAAQQELKDLTPEIIRITRVDHTLNGTCEWAKLQDEEDEPVFSEDGHLLKIFILRAQTTEN